MGLRKKDRDMQQEILLRKKNWKRAYIIEILYLYNLITQKSCADQLINTKEDYEKQYIHKLKHPKKVKHVQNIHKC